MPIAYWLQGHDPPMLERDFLYEPLRPKIIEPHFDDHRHVDRHRRALWTFVRIPEIQQNAFAYLIACCRAFFSNEGIKNLG